MKNNLTRSTSLQITLIVTGFFTITLLCVAGIHPAKAEDKPMAEASVSLLSKYVWRGYELSKDSLVIQPAMSISYKGAGIEFWGNLDTDYYPTGSSNWNETDVTLFYDGSYEKLGYGAGWMYYALEDGYDDTQEIYATLGYDVILSPTFSFYYDIDDLSGAWYATIGISHTFEIAEKYDLDLGFTVGYLDDNEGYDVFHDGLLSVSMIFPVNDYVSIVPELYYSFPLTDEASDQIKAESFDGDDDNFVYGGISASFEV